jgi:DNA-binding NarL/FixJ family response regulator
MKPRVLIAEDHSLVAQGVEKLLEQEFQFCGRVTEGRALVRAVEKENPDITLVDIGLPLLNGLDACRLIRKVTPEAKLLILTMHSDHRLVTDAFRAGVSGYVLKQSVTEELLFAMKEVLKGRVYVSPSVAENFVEQAVHPAEAHLSGGSQREKVSLRQREVLQLIAEGQTTKEIAFTLNVGIKTIEFHKTRLMKQFGVHSAAELASHAISLGLVVMPQHASQAAGTNSV